MEAYRTVLNYVLFVFIVLVHLTWAQPSMHSFWTKVQQTSGFTAVLTCQVENLGNAKVKIIYFF